MTIAKSVITMFGLWLHYWSWNVSVYNNVLTIWHSYGHVWRGLNHVYQLVLYHSHFWLSCDQLFKPDMAMSHLTYLAKPCFIHGQMMVNLVPFLVQIWPKTDCGINRHSFDSVMVRPCTGISFEIQLFIETNFNIFIKILFACNMTTILWYWSMCTTFDHDQIGSKWVYTAD